jgi:hypothetical protein
LFARHGTFSGKHVKLDDRYLRLPPPQYVVPAFRDGEKASPAVPNENSFIVMDLDSPHV